MAHGGVNDDAMDDVMWPWVTLWSTLITPSVEDFKDYTSPFSYFCT